MKNEKLVSKARDIMRTLEEQIGETIGLGVLVPGSGNGVLLVSRSGSSGFSFHLEEGFLFPLHTSAPGKVMMAYLPADQRAAYYEHIDFRKYTANTITRRSDFEAELESVVENGYSIDVSEQLEGCHCIGVPVFDAERTVAAALWTTGPSSRLPVRQFDPVSVILKKGAEEISDRLRTTRRAPNRKYINSVVRQAQDILDSSLDEAPDVQQLARNLYVSYAWFRKAFKDEVGESPVQYHLNRRLDRARELLSDTDLSVRQISETLGFKTQNHFSALFKRKTGLSPSMFRGQL
ncbi:MAG TPA: IclR family transcriptional regulator C-terminal domain-containing protein [Tichowtungia sp.]|nr:IclR family transcriptional regulator C-terminal domain-containing protein [Tichowtungia sp.]